MTGLWMQRMAMGWLVYDLTGANKALGIMDFVAYIPSAFLAPLAGALIESWDLRKALFVSQVLCMVQAFVLAVLTWFRWITFDQLILLGAFLGIVNAFDMPIRQSLVVYMVEDRADLSNAVALNSSLFNVARLLGPSFAGIVISKVGEAVCFFLNSVSYLVTLGALRVMRLSRVPRAHEATRKKSFAGLVRQYGSGFRMVGRYPPYRYVLLLITFSGIFGFPYIVLMPAMARDVLMGDSRTMGYLLAATGGGALLGSLFMAARKSPRNLDRWLPRAAIGFGLSEAAFALCRTPTAAIVVLPVLGFCMVSSMISCNTLLQSLVDDAKRPRLMGLYILAAVGVSPFGSLVIGFLGDILGTSPALFISGSLCISISFYFSRKLRPYRANIDKMLHRRGF